MGLSDILNRATGDKDAKYSMFNRAQVQQLILAESQGVQNTECLKHKEWGPTLMNYCWNREKEGKSLSDVYTVAEWLGKTFPSDDDSGTIYDNMDIIWYAFNQVKNGKPIRSPEFEEDGSYDEDMYEFLTTVDRLSDECGLLTSGRVILNYDKMKFVDDIVLMGEGNHKALQIAQALQSWAADKKNEQDTAHTDIWDKVSDRQWNMINILLGLDDMNIRGYQLVYAMDYADSSIERLHSILQEGRSKELCDYINMRSARDFLAGDTTHNQVAVTSGASFQKIDGGMYLQEPMTLIMDDLTAEYYSELEAQAESVDYSKLDIRNTVSLSSAIKICEARGFKTVGLIKRKNKFNKDVSCLIMFNPETKDYITADTAQESDITYGGVSLIMHRTIPSYSHIFTKFGMNCSNGNHTGQDGHWFEFTHNEGLFRAWDALKEYVPSKDYDWSLIGFGRTSIPIPKYFELPFMRDADMWDLIGDDAAIVMRNMGSFYFEGLVNGMIALSDKSLSVSVSPHYSMYGDWLLDEGLRDLSGWYSGNDSKACIIASLVFTYLKVPKDLMDSMVSGAYNVFKNRDAIMSSGDRKSNEASDFLKCVKGLTNSHPLCKRIIDGYKLPNPEDLSVRPYWL